MIFTGDFLTCSRRQRTKEFNAAFEALYAGIATAGMMDRLEVVLE